MKEELVQYLSLLLKETTTVTHAKGFLYLKHGFMPRLLEAGKVKEIDNEMIVLAWLRAAEIYAINGAPKRSITCVKKAHALMPKHNLVLEQLIQLHASMGQFHDAFAFVNQLIDEYPDRFEYMTLRQKIQDDINYDSQAPYLPHNQLWSLDEQLASEQFGEVINTVLDSSMNDVALLKRLACAYGAIGHNSNYYMVWNTILKLNKNEQKLALDLFYQPVENI